jgi:hypothetical protein
VRVFKRKGRKGLREERKVFFARKDAKSQSFFLQQTLRIVSLSEVEDHARSFVKKIANLCRVTYVVFDFAQTDKTRRIKKIPNPNRKIGIWNLEFLYWEIIKLTYKVDDFSWNDNHFVWRSSV